MYAMTLSDGTKIEGLTIEHSVIYSDNPITAGMLRGKLSPVTIEGESAEGDPPVNLAVLGTHSHLGGATAYGVTWSTLKAAYRAGITEHDDICRLTVEEAKRIYRVNYWEKWKWNELEWPVCLCALDCCVNHGGFAKILQRAVNACGVEVAVDNKMGPKTLAGMKACDPYELAGKIYEARKRYFEDIVRRNASQGVFLKGWLRRCEEMKNLTACGKVI